MPPVDHFQQLGLSEGARLILKHFRDKGFKQLEYEYPAALLSLFTDSAVCEQSLRELRALGYIEVGPTVPRHVPVAHRVPAAAITLEGQRFIAAGGLDD